MPSLSAMAREAKEKKTITSPKKAVRKAPTPASTLSTEFVQESDGEDSNSDKESNSDNDSLPANPAKTSTKINGNAAVPAVSSSSESESDSAESDSEDQEEEEGDELNNTNKLKLAVSEPTKKPTKEPTIRTVSFKAVTPYKPPTGFEPTSLNGAPKASQLFKKSNLEGKQIWYFTAPASVPISAVEEMSLQAAKESRTVISHNGSDYGFVQDAAEDKVYTKIMVPSSSDDGYRAGVKPIDQILHLQRIVKLPNVYNASMNATSPVNPRVIAPAQNPIREQPEGLKMRFRPIGFGRGRTGNIGSSSLEGSATESASDEEMLDAPAFRRPLSTEKDMSSDSAESSSSSEVDGDMTDAAAPTPKRAAKEVVRTTDTLLKRKHSEGADKQSKKSSSISTTTPDNMQLKRFKTKQTEYQKNMADRQSVSTKVHKSDTSITPGSFGSQVKSSELPPPIGILSFTNPPPSSAVPALTSSAPSGKSSELAASNRTFKTVKPSSSSPIRPATIKVSPIPPPWPRLTQPQFSQSSQTLDKQESPMKSESMRKDRGSKKTPVRDEKSELSLQELTRATDPNLTGEERQEEIRRLKTASKAKRRETTKSPGERIVDVPKTIPVPPPPPKSQSRPQNQSSSPTYIRTSSAGNIVSRGKSRRNSRIQRPI